MSRWIFSTILSFVTILYVKGLGIGDILSVDYQDLDTFNEIPDDSEDEQRLIIIPALQLNISSLSSALPLAIAAVSSMISLIGTIALGVILISLLTKLKYDDGYSYGSGYGHGSGSYSSYRSIFNSMIKEWETFSLLDLIEVGEELWDKYEPTNPECQKRFICEIHNNTSKLGFAAHKFVELFEYLYYSRVFRLPRKLQDVLDGYLDAAQLTDIVKGKNCGDLFPDCKFSVSKIAEKINQNSI